VERVCFAAPSAHRLLYDQNNMDQMLGIVSQNFEHVFDVYDAQGADDFTVPAGERWTVKEVDVTGAYFNGPGPANSENVFIYASAIGRPGAVLHRCLRVVGADNGTGSFAIDLGRGVKLAAGHYWVSIQVNMHFNHRGEWGWEARTMQHRKPAMWRNPGDGFGEGCTSYRPVIKCIPGPQSLDFMFALRGDKQGGVG
jgi:hypothetical protein